MRIIGGKYRGRKIKQPMLGTVRPTKDRIREAVFNIIAAEVPDSNILDIFAGTGAYGLEALSRGSEKAVFVEKDIRAADIITENVSMLDIDGQIEIIAKDAFSYIEALGEENRAFDLIFVDPPYNKDMARKTLIMINHYDILEPSGLLIIEHNIKENIPGHEGNVSLCKQKTYGKTVISVFKKND